MKLAKPKPKTKPKPKPKPWPAAVDAADGFALALDYRPSGRRGDT